MDWKYSKHILRGLMDTDGCLYFSKSAGNIRYPRLEIKTASNALAHQIISLLNQNNFKPHSTSKKTDNTTAIYLSGPKMLERWVLEIGFSNIRNISKYRFWKKFNYYIPRISQKERLKMLR